MSRSPASTPPRPSLLARETTALQQVLQMQAEDAAARQETSKIVNNGVRRPMVNTGPFTLVLCSCANGSQMTPTFIWQSSELNEVATVTSEHDAFEAATSTGYITTELFAEWFRKFVERVIGVCVDPFATSPPPNCLPLTVVRILTTTGRCHCE
jgi:hypothetical protein